MMVPAEATAARGSPARFVVTCAARTGSTMLTTCLQQHPDVVMHGEVFGATGPLAFFGVQYAVDPPLEGVLRELRDRDPVAFLYDLVFRAGHRHAVGCKFKYEEMLRPEHSGLLAALSHDRDVRVVHLRRDDLLERYLSQHIAVSVTGVFNVQQGEVPEEVTVRLDPEACRADFERTTRRHARVAELFAAHPVLDLTYEELLEDLPEALGRVAAFLGVAHFDVEPRTKRLRRRTARDTIENFDELAAYFAGGAFGHLFEPALS